MPKAKKIKDNLEDMIEPYLGGFQLEFVSISRVINHMTCYKFECSHWWKIYTLKKSFTRFALQSECFQPMRGTES